MPWPLSENLVVAGYPKPADVVKQYWNDSGVCMITLCKKQIAPEVPAMLNHHVYLPIPDGRLTPERTALIWQARDHVLDMMNRPDTRLTVVHCLAGRNRSVLVASLALQWVNNWTGEEAFTWARQCRPNSLHNVEFETFLRSLGRPR